MIKTPDASTNLHSLQLIRGSNSTRTELKISLPMVNYWHRNYINGLLSAKMKNVKGKIILIDDEAYEADFLERALKEKNWDITIEYFHNVDDAIEHLKMNPDEIFLIISDLEMPRKSGLDLKKIIDNDAYLSQKSIPFIFVSNVISREKVIEAYKLHAQGYFQKPMTPGEQAKMFEIIIRYWNACLHPTKEDLPKNPNLV
jgi:DNA-binding NtrC family response regulator